MKGSSTQNILLIIDDTPHSVKALLSFLMQANFTVLYAQDGEEGIQTAEYARPQLILLDVMMPQLDGFSVCQLLKSNPVTQHIPILFMSALTDSVDKVKGLKLGACDYITKPIHYEEALARINTHLRVHQQQLQLEAEIKHHQHTQNNLQTTADRLAQQTLELQHRTQELEKCNQELDTFAHTVAHDLKNPLNAIVNISDILLEHTDIGQTIDEKWLKKLEMIELAGQQAIQIIEALLALAGVSRKHHIETKPLEMQSIMATIVEQRLAHMIKMAQATVELPDQWPLAQGYRPWIEAVWINYISNGLKYGGRPPHLVLGADSQQQHICFWVRDNGYGLTLEQQTRLFTPFTRLHQHTAEGHGLGLSIVRQIIEKLGGQVGVDSRIGEGSCFYFTLPKPNTLKKLNL